MELADGDRLTVSRLTWPRLWMSGSASLQEKSIQPTSEVLLMEAPESKRRPLGYEIHLRFSPLQYLAFISVQNLTFPAVLVSADHL